MSQCSEEISTDCQSSEDEAPPKPPLLVSQSGVLDVSVSLVLSNIKQDHTALIGRVPCKDED